MIPWLTENYVELLGVIFSIIYLFFSIRQRIWLWPMGILSALLYMVVFFRSKFYADMGLNGYYVVVSIYGWIHWKKGAGEPGKALSIGRITTKTGILLFLITVCAFFLIGLLLKNFTDSPIPFWDAFTTALSFAATWLLARKILEHWIVWIVVDAISMGLYLYRGLYPTLVLFAIYTALAVIGYLEWKKSLASTKW